MICLLFASDDVIPSSFLINRVSKNGICPSVSSSYVNRMLPMESTKFRCTVSCATLPLFITSNMSSTNLFHSLGLQFTGAVAIAHCSSHSINKFAIMGDTGHHCCAKSLLIYYSLKAEVPGSHVWNKLLHIDNRHRKTVLMKASDVKPKRR